MFAEVEFAADYAGRTSIRVGSAHLNNERAKKFDVATNCLKGLLEKAEQLQVDIIGIDINRGEQFHAPHGDSPLSKAFRLIKANRTDPGQQVVPECKLGPPAEDDCVGFLIPPSSKLWKDCVLTSVSYFCLEGSDIGIRSSDEGTHRPVVAHFRVKGNQNKRKRTDASKHARRQRSSKVRKTNRVQRTRAFATSGATTGATPESNSTTGAAKGESKGNSSSFSDDSEGGDREVSPASVSSNRMVV